MSQQAGYVHPVSWIVWTVIIAGATTLTRNPMYLGLLLGVVLVQNAAATQRRGDAQGWQMLVRASLGFALLIIPFNALNVHAGSHVLFHLPDSWPLIGGAITVEAAVWGACSALSLATLIVLFATLNLHVDQAQMLRLAPGFIFEAGLIVSIALTFVPQMMTGAREIREAQLVRGHRIRRARDMLPFVMALLTSGLERSFQLAESMEARGFGNVRDQDRRQDVLYKALTLLGLAGILSGFFVLTYWSSFALPGWSVLLSGAALLLGAFWAQGKRVLRTRYRRDDWTWRDATVLTVGLVAGLALAIVRVRDPAALVYSPYEELLPSFHPWLGVSLLALVAPALLRPGQSDPSIETGQ